MSLNKVSKGGEGRATQRCAQMQLQCKIHMPANFACLSRAVSRPGRALGTLLAGINKKCSNYM